jgi:hypothetical protein
MPRMSSHVLQGSSEEKRPQEKKERGRSRQWTVFVLLGLAGVLAYTKTRRNISQQLQPFLQECNSTWWCQGLHHRRDITARAQNVGAMTSRNRLRLARLL